MMLVDMHSHLLQGLDDGAAGVQQSLQLAHSAYNNALMRTPDRAKCFVSPGCAVQLTSGSVCGRFGEDAYAAAQEMLSRHWVAVTTSDADNGSARPPELKPGRDAAALVTGTDEAAALIIDKPWSLVSGMFDV
ncbi:MAG: hypothetical protein COW18_01845 [Zetaproteobacteria bacterium CG12_big_fil_rev_8_21_14_0_65_54_13]|nr:MAG: hypothetical protein COW18_01845 [Zetaproteobacteria bacterium CG12_big_fil_rev_8_21_14_0_65_54_13]PJA28988.1 MAG: hypothetical protein CO188_07860 [Zetaproteobacteria bacterium CG_4_9_14_3_um_filter_54_145]